MRPPGSVIRRVRVALMVAVLMMDPVDRHPGDGTSLQRERPADGQEVLHQLGHAIAAVRQQAMVAHADAHVDREPIEYRCNDQVRPAEEEEGCDGARYGRWP